VGLYVLATVGPFLPLLLSVPFTLEPIALASPFFAAGDLTALLHRIADGRPDLFWNAATWGVLWVTAYLAAAVVLFLLTLATFDRCLGRMTTSTGRRRIPHGRAGHG
jgi:hypothetical protein